MFMRDHAADFPIQVMSEVLGVSRSGYYAWLQAPLSERAKEDQRLLGSIKQAWLESGGVYGHRKVTLDLRGHPEAQAGDPVQLWGEGLPLETVAAAAGTISYEPACQVTRRVCFRQD